MKQSQTKTLLVSSCCHKHLKFFTPPFITFSTRIFTPVGKSLHEQRSHRSHLFAALLHAYLAVISQHRQLSHPVVFLLPHQQQVLLLPVAPHLELGIVAVCWPSLWSLETCSMKFLRLVPSQLSMRQLSTTEILGSSFSSSWTHINLPQPAARH